MKFRIVGTYRKSGQHFDTTIDVASPEVVERWARQYDLQCDRVESVGPPAVTADPPPPPAGAGGSLVPPGEGLLARAGVAGKSPPPLPETAMPVAADPEPVAFGIGIAAPKPIELPPEAFEPPVRTTRPIMAWVAVLFSALLLTGAFTGHVPTGLDYIVKLLSRRDLQSVFGGVIALVAFNSLGLLAMAVGVRAYLIADNAQSRAIMTFASLILCGGVVFQFVGGFKKADATRPPMPTIAVAVDPSAANATSTATDPFATVQDSGPAGDTTDPFADVTDGNAPITGSDTNSTGGQIRIRAGIPRGTQKPVVPAIDRVRQVAREYFGAIDAHRVIFEKALEQQEMDHLLDPENLRTALQVQEARDRLRHAARAFVRYESNTRLELTSFDRRLDEAKVPLETRAALLTRLETTRLTNGKRIDRLMEVERGILKEMGSALKFLETHYGQYAVRNSRLVFNTNADARLFDQCLDRLAKLAEESARLRATSDAQNDQAIASL